MDSVVKTRLLVLGAGPGGYAAAFYAADKGMDVVCVDAGDKPGGVCLNRGCIPSKALLHAAKVIKDAAQARDFGVTFNAPQIDVAKLREWKNSVVSQLTGGLGQLAQKRNVRYINGVGCFENSNLLVVRTAGGEEVKVEFDFAVIASGSVPACVPGLDKVQGIWDSTGALALESVPASLLVVGGGYIGVELGSVYSALGSRVSVVEMTGGILPGADKDMVSVLSRKLKGEFENMYFKSRVTGIKAVDGGFKVSIESLKDSHTDELFFEKVLVSIGRKPNSTGLGLENAGVSVGSGGFIDIKPDGKTTADNIYAIGDVAGQPMLAHKAAHQAKVAVDALLGEKTEFAPKAIPAVVFTDPEIAWCGLTQTQAREEKLDVSVAKFPWGASGRALAIGSTEGFTKLIIDNQTQKVLGVGIVGTGAGDLIAEGVLAVQAGLGAHDVAHAIHPHPTLSETLMESAEVFYGYCSHIYKPKG